MDLPDLTKRHLTRQADAFGASAPPLDGRWLAEAIREALQVAVEGRPGPVLVDIPKDVQQGEGGRYGGTTVRR